MSAELPRAQSESDRLIGTIIGERYAIESRLGEGAMGTVYKARHVKVGRPFAVKILHPRLLNEEKLLRRFEREAELAGLLRHPNVIGVVDVGTTPDGLHYMVMDFALGPDMATLLASAPLPGPRVISIVRQLCDGLQHAHEQGLIHRDFKPENVIVESDREGNEIPRIVDFGIAILQDAGDSASSDGRLTTNGLVLGTPHYMAPEQAVADPIDHRIDLFALGIIMYEMLTGRLPFDGTGAEVARANLVLDPPAMAKRVPHLAVDPLLESFTRKLMAKNRERRPATAKAARELLDLIVKDRPAAARALGVPPERPAMSTEPALEISELMDIEEPRSGTTGLDAPPLSAAVAVRDPSLHVEVRPTPTTMATPLPWRTGNRRGLMIAGIAGMAIFGGVIAVAVTGHHDKPTEVATVDHAPIATPTPPPVPPPTPVPVPVVVPTAGSDVGSGSGSSAPEIVMDPPNPVKPTTTPTISKVTVHPPKLPTTHPATDSHVALALPTPVPTPTPTPQPPVAVHPTPTPTPTPVPATPAGPITPSSLAAQYSAVGTQLKALEDEHGAEATRDLWPRYRLIRFNEALGSADKRAEASATLAKLHRDIVGRTK